MTDDVMVEKPPHYNKGGLEAIEVIIAFLGLEGAYYYCRGNQIKYGLRADDKNATLQDHKKLRWYTNSAIDLYERLQDEKISKLPEPPF